MTWLVLHLDAPLMSFGGVAVDANRVTDPHPSASMLTGLIANALGWVHEQVQDLQHLQARLRFGTREDLHEWGRVQRLVDYHTVDLGQAHLDGTGWTREGVVEQRAGAFSKGTHIRHRHFLADASFTMVLRLDDGDGPTLEQVEEALRYPARSLFLGRKCCPPARPLFAGHVEADNVRDALTRAPVVPGTEHAKPRRAWWQVSEWTADGHVAPHHGHRDWANQVHVGKQWVRSENVTVGGDRG